MPHYSASTGGLYPNISMFSPDALPGDLVEISEQEYKEKAGAVVSYGDTPVGVPTSVTMRQARLALLAANKLSAINAAMADASEALRIDWEFAATVDRNSPTVAAMAQVLNLTADDLDGLFTAAAKL